MEKVVFSSKDGLKIEGEIFGSSNHAVVLAHGKAFNMQSWEDFSVYLEKNGFSAIPFNFRGYGNSQSKDNEYELDIAGIIDEISKKYDYISLIGASMGGTAALRALEITKAVDGLILLSPAGLPKNFDNLKGKAKRALVAFSKKEFAFDSAEKVAKSLPIDTETLIFDGTLHAQNLFKDAEISNVLENKIINFLRSLGK